MQYLFVLDFALIVGLLLFISYQDIRYRLIANKWLLILTLPILCLCLVLGHWPFLMQGTIVFCIGLLLFYLGIVGGGDVKFIALLALVIPPEDVPIFLFVTSCVGGVITIGGLIFYPKAIRQLGVPYGVAISLGFIVTHLAMQFSVLKDI